MNKTITTIDLYKKFFTYSKQDADTSIQASDVFKKKHSDCPRPAHIDCLDICLADSFIDEWMEEIEALVDKHGVECLKNGQMLCLEMDEEMIGTLIDRAVLEYVADNIKDETVLDNIIDLVSPLRPVRYISMHSEDESWSMMVRVKEAVTSFHLSTTHAFDDIEPDDDIASNEDGKLYLYFSWDDVVESSWCEASMENVEEDVNYVMLKWNTGTSSYTKEMFNKQLSAYNSGEKVLMTWAVTDESVIVEGDKVCLAMIDELQDGIVAMGKVVRAPYKDADAEEYVLDFIVEEMYDPAGYIANIDEGSTDWYHAPSGTVIADNMEKDAWAGYL